MKFDYIKIAVILIFVAGLLYKDAVIAEESLTNREYRDPFVPLVGDFSKIGKEKTEKITAVDGAVLQGIVISPDGTRKAIINGELLKQGDITGALTVKSIEDNTVIVNIQSVDYKLKLYNENEKENYR